MQSFVFAFCGLLAFGPDVPAVKAGAAKVENLSVNLELKPADARYQLPAPTPQQVKLSEQPGPSAKSPPAKKGLLWGEIPFGPTSQPSGVAIMVDESNPSAATLRVDTNRNGDLTDDPAVEWKLLDGDRPDLARYEGEFSISTRDGSGGERLKLVAYRYLPAGSKARGLPEQALFYFRDYGASGTTKIANGARPIALTDESSIGDFTFPGGRSTNLMVGLDTDGDGTIKPGIEWYPANQVLTVLGQQVQLKSASPDGRHVELTMAPAGAKIANAFSGPALGGGTIKFPEDFKNKLVLVTFWASWCPHCKQEMPNVVKLEKQLKDEKDLAFLGVSVDRAGSDQAVKDYMKQAGISWPQLFDGNAFNCLAAKQYSVNGVPALFLIDTGSMTIVADGMTLRGDQLPNTVSSWVRSRKKPS